MTPCPPRSHPISWGIIIYIVFKVIAIDCVYSMSEKHGIGTLNQNLWHCVQSIAGKYAEKVFMETSFICGMKK